MMMPLANLGPHTSTMALRGPYPIMETRRDSFEVALTANSSRFLVTRRVSEAVSTPVFPCLRGDFRKSATSKRVTEAKTAEKRRDSLRRRIADDVFSSLHRQGLTLLETILALALSAIVMGLLCSAVRLQMQMLDTRRTGIEQASVARAVMGYLRRDLQGTVRFEAAEETTTDTASETTGAGADDTGDEFAEEDVSTDTEAVSTLMQSKPGFYGTASELRVEVTRFPDPRAFDAIQAGQVVSSSVPLSGLQTVRYFLAASSAIGQQGNVVPTQDATGNTTNGSHDEICAATGLARQTIDYEAAAWAIESGSTADLDQSIEVLAPEVIALEFGYYDGTQWLSEWDSEQMAALPVAVAITLVLADTREGVATQRDMNSLTTLSGNLVFRTVVRLPVVDLPVAGTSDEEEILQ